MSFILIYVYHVIIPFKLIPFRFHAFRPDRSSTLDMYLVKSLMLHTVGYMIYLVHVKDDGVLVTPPWNQLRKCRHTNHINSS